MNPLSGLKIEPIDWFLSHDATSIIVKSIRRSDGKTLEKSLPADDPMNRMYLLLGELAGSTLGAYDTVHIDGKVYVALVPYPIPRA